MTAAALITLGVIGLVIVALALTSWPVEVVMLGALTVLMTTGVITERDAIAGFANEGVVTIGVLFVVAAGIRETGVMSWLGQRLLGRPQSTPAAQLRLMVPTAMGSAFLNNTPLVAVLLPVVRDWSKKNGIAVSKLMMPLSFAAILGGLCTLIGTSTNLVVSGLWAKALQSPLQLFDPAWIGVPCVVVGMAYMVIASRWWLPDRRPAITDQDDPRQYTVEMMVDQQGPLVGLTIEQAGLRHLPGLYLAEIERQQELVPAVSPRERLQARDRLVFVGIVESVVDLQRIPGLVPATNQVFKLDGPRTQRCLLEAVVSDTCPLIGRSIREGKFRTVYDAAIIALARNGERIRKKLGDVVLQPGDTLLLEAPPEFADRQRNSRDFYLVSAIADSAPPKHERRWWALSILIAMVVAAGMGWLSMLNAGLLAAGLMLATGCCSTAAARRSIEWPVLLVIAAALGVARALEVSGGAQAIVDAVMPPLMGRPWLALAALYFLTMIFTEVMSNAASVALVFPIALAAAQTMAVSPRPLVMAIMVAASCGFATPLGYATNLMVYGPGGYRFGDFLRFGGGLNLVVAAVTIALAPLIWPFTGK